MSAVSGATPEDGTQDDHEDIPETITLYICSMDPTVPGQSFSQAWSVSRGRIQIWGIDQQQDYTCVQLHGGFNLGFKLVSIMEVITLNKVSCQDRNLSVIFL